MSINKLIPGDSLPSLTVAKLGGGEFDLTKPTGSCDWQMIVVYRGKHCPICTNYLKTLEELLPKFQELGVSVTVVSADTEERAKVQIADVNPSYDVGYGLTVEQMSALGLYISSPRSPEETDRPFAEPGLFIVDDKGVIQTIDITNAPFVRPELNLVIMGLGFIRNPDNNYPIRGMAYHA